jgi:hypothetical protein
MLWPLKLACFVVTLTGAMDRSDMSRMDSSSEASVHLRESVSFLPSLAEVVISPDIFIHLLKQLLQSLWRLPGEVLSHRSWPKTLDHGLNDDFIGHCGRLCPQSQEPSDISLKVFLMVLCALEQGLSCDWLRLKALEAGNQHILELLPRRDCSWTKRRIPCLGYVPNCHDEGLCHDSHVASI